MTVFFCFYIALLLAVCFITETRYNNSKKILEAEIREKQALDLISAGAGRSPESQGISAKACSKTDTAL